MTKKYKHKPTYKSTENQLRSTNIKLINKNEILKSENNRLEMALKLITGEDKQKLLDAMEYIEQQYTQPAYIYPDAAGVTWTNLAPSITDVSTIAIGTANTTAIIGTKV